MRWLAVCLTVVLAGCASAPSPAQGVDPGATLPTWRLTVHVEVIDHRGSLQTGYWEKAGIANATLRVDGQIVNRTDQAGNSVLAFHAAPGQHNVTATSQWGNRTAAVRLDASLGFDLDDGAPDWDHPNVRITFQP